MNTYILQLHCPDIENQADVMQAKAALGNSPGFDHAEIDITRHQVILTTANQDQGKDAIYRLTHAGFPPDDSVVLPLTPRTV